MSKLDSGASPSLESVRVWCAWGWGVVCVTVASPRGGGGMSEAVAVARLSVLEQPKLKDLVEELFGVKKKWYSIGLQLNVSDDTLDNIDAECKDVHTVTLRRMLQEWRKQEETSWAALVNALQSQSVSEFTLAKNLKGRYIGTANTDEGSLSLPFRQSRRAQDQFCDQVVPTTDGARKLVYFIVRVTGKIRS